MQATTRGPRVPHLFVNRARLHDLTGDDADLRAQCRWETLNAVIYWASAMKKAAPQARFVRAICDPKQPLVNQLKSMGDK